MIPIFGYRIKTIKIPAKKNIVDVILSYRKKNWRDFCMPIIKGIPDKKSIWLLVYDYVSNRQKTTVKQHKNAQNHKEYAESC